MNSGAHWLFFNFFLPNYIKFGNVLLFMQTHLQSSGIKNLGCTSSYIIMYVRRNIGPCTQVCTGTIDHDRLGLSFFSWPEQVQWFTLSVDSHQQLHNFAPCTINTGTMNQIAWNDHTLLLPTIHGTQSSMYIEFAAINTEWKSQWPKAYMPLG